METQSAALLYRVACDLETEVLRLGGADSDAIAALRLWRDMDAALLELHDLLERSERVRCSQNNLVKYYS